MPFFLFLLIFAAVVMLYVAVAYLNWQFAKFFFDFFARKNGALYFPSRQEVIMHMIELVGPLHGKRVIDLGSGDGRLLQAVVRAGAQRAIGFEINPVLVWESRFKIWNAGLGDRIRIERSSYWTTPLPKVDVVMVYGIDRIMARLEKKLMSELPVGTKIISNHFPFPHWRPVKHKGDVFVYVMKKGLSPDRIRPHV